MYKVVFTGYNPYIDHPFEDGQTLEYLGFTSYDEALGEVENHLEMTWLHDFVDYINGSWWTDYQGDGKLRKIMEIEQYV